MRGSSATQSKTALHAKIARSKANELQTKKESQRVQEGKCLNNFSENLVKSLWNDEASSWYEVELSHSFLSYTERNFPCGASQLDWNTFQEDYLFNKDTPPPLKGWSDKTWAKPTSAAALQEP